jgi:hypothetical protein
MVTWCFKGPEKVIFWFVLLFCRLLQRGLGELVSVMECDLSCSINTLMRCVNHGSTRGLARRFKGSEGMRSEGVYMRLVDKNKGM